MRFALISSELDPASQNIKYRLLERTVHSECGLFDNNPVFSINGLEANVYTLKSELVNRENLSSQIDADFFIFMSRHKSSSAIPSLSVHATGNWGEACLGGIPRRLSLSDASFLKQALIIMSKLNRNSSYDVIQECTHHGPFIDKPHMFIEIGSDEERWRDTEAASVISEVILRIMSEEVPKCRTAIGIGGLHTLTNFKKVILNSEYGISHACPKYALSNLNLDMLQEAFSKSVPRPEAIILDWKGLGPEKERVSKIASQFASEKGLKLLRTSDF